MKRINKAYTQIKHLALCNTVIKANIPQTLKQQILAGLCRAFNNKTLEPRARTLGGAFIWQNTPEGHKFWDTANRILLKQEYLE